MGVISQIVNRAHAGESNLSVCRRVYLAMKPEFRRDPFYRVTRKAYYAEAIRVHTGNERLYYDVMMGRVG